jgi:hypothetical protein
VLNDLKQHQHNDSQSNIKSLYIQNYSSNVDLFHIDYKNAIKCFSKLILTKISNKFLTGKNSIAALNDTFKGYLLVLMQIHKAKQLYNVIFNSIKAKQSFKFEYFFTYITGKGSY